MYINDKVVGYPVENNSKNNSIKVKGKNRNKAGKCNSELVQVTTVKCII